MTFYSNYQILTKIGLNTRHFSKTFRIYRLKNKKLWLYNGLKDKDIKKIGFALTILPVVFNMFT